MTEAVQCTVCNRDAERMNSRVAECSHVDCPHRRRAWSNGTRDHIRDLSKPPEKAKDPPPLDKSEFVTPRRYVKPYDDID